MPSDIVALQEIVWETRPQLVIETGVARGGSLILSASILELIGEGEVLGIDIDIRAAQPRGDRVASARATASAWSRARRSMTRSSRRRAAAAERVERVMVVLDSNHTHEHVLGRAASLRRRSSRSGQFLVVADTFIEHIPPQEHRPRPWGPGDNPGTALRPGWRRRTPSSADAFVNAKLLLTAIARAATSAACADAVRATTSTRPATRTRDRNAGRIRPRRVVAARRRRRAYLRPPNPAHRSRKASSRPTSRATARRDLGDRRPGAGADVDVAR